ncbi:cytochrome c peroxidase [Filimonas zeae]|uniref:Methylamine utilization protein MauG n=1 Tax=Filimonas zeae TaxID=1737353 RepID=A0A917IQL4_9BACT|nr:cytochrome c peroxidase [Filimonas zeae]MDR6337796.1 cytochrome c peroxidase [Filimonas zeae]GGH60305.1 methylamine utilization protein [Filimonas zeae]
MKKALVLLMIVIALAGILTSFRLMEGSEGPGYSIDSLRIIYSGGDAAKWPRPNLDSSVMPGFQDIGALGKPPYPADNPWSKEKEQLGKLLFYDPRLSQSGQISCASCHDPELGWGDGRRVSYGHNRQTGRRNAMTVLNTAYYTHLFWDGRAGSLEEQSVFPVQDPKEMAQTLTAMVSNVRGIKGYREYFKKAFNSDSVTLNYIQQAIATFERSVVSHSSRFDQFVSGKSNALSNEEVMGMHLFRTKARCINCHNTPLFSDNQFHNDGQSLYGAKMQDLGRYETTKDKKDLGVFRTPSIREVAQTGPWMHHGNFPTLMDVIEYYNLGNPSPIQKHVVIDSSTLPTTSPILRKLNLSLEERKCIEAFLRAISTTPRKPFAPELPQ